MEAKSVFDKLVNINQKVKVLICSEYTKEEVKSAFGEIRHLAIIQKPCKPNRLLERISWILALE